MNLKQIISGSFRWAESHDLIDYSNWRNGEPNDSPSYGGEDCGHVSGYVGHSFGWNDANCNLLSLWELPFHALCQLHN